MSERREEERERPAKTVWTHQGVAENEEDTLKERRKEEKAVELGLMFHFNAVLDEKWRSLVYVCAISKTCIIGVT